MTSSSRVLRPDFAADLRDRLMDEAPEAARRRRRGHAPGRRGRELPGQSAPPYGGHRRRCRRLVVGSTAGVAAASQSALPGETLYPVKRGIEQHQVTVARSDHGKGSEYLDQASTRLDEISDLAVAHADDPSTPGLVRDTLEDFATQADDGAERADRVLRDDGDEQSISRAAGLRRRAPPATSTT